MSLKCPKVFNAYLCWHDYLPTLLAGGERKVLSFPHNKAVAGLKI
jgi:hypothetical protein